MIEKPSSPRSDWAVTGLYFFDNKVVNIAATLPKSHRGEREITDLLKIYLSQQELSVEKLGRGFTWLDTGTCSSLLEAAQFVETVEKRQGFKVACLEEIAYAQRWLSARELLKNAGRAGNKEYVNYLTKLVGGRSHDK